MVTIENALVEAAIIKAIDEVKNKCKSIEGAVDTEFCPGRFITSQILVTLMGRIASALKVKVPDSCYIFHEKRTLRKLSIKESAEKLIKEAEYEK